ncbi:MAG: chromate transporter [bacterium]
MDKVIKRDKHEPTIKNLFLVFLKIGTFAFGGVYSMLTFFERELATKKKWLSHDEFAEAVAIGQLTPGPPIINTGIFIGYTLKKLKGALATVVGQVLPSFVLILVIAHFYIKYKDISIIHSILKGVGAAVVGMIAAVVYNMGKKFLKDYKSISFAVVMFVCLGVFKLNPIFLIIASALGGLIVYRKGKH